MRQLSETPSNLWIKPACVDLLSELCDPLAYRRRAIQFRQRVDFRYGAVLFPAADSAEFCSLLRIAAEKTGLLQSQPPGTVFPRL